MPSKFITNQEKASEIEEGRESLIISKELN